MKMFISILMIGLFISCNNEEVVQNHQAGGVDGSGGKLLRQRKNEIDSWFKNSHPFFMKDVINRLYLIKENNNTPLYPESLNELIKIKKDELFKIIDSMKFQVVSEKCDSINHGKNADASVTPDGKVCISYLAFSLFSYEEFFAKAMAITLHELAHLVNLSENQATEIQEVFEKDFSYGRDELLYLYNKKLENYVKAIKNMNFRLSSAFHQLVLERSKDYYKICKDIIRIEEIIWNVLVDTNVVLPKYLSTEANRKIYDKIRDLSKDCSEANFNSKELAKKIISTVNSIWEFQQKFDLYSLSSCQQSFCDFRWEGNRSSRHILKLWESTKNTFFKNQSLEEIDIKNVTCTMRSVDNKNLLKSSSKDLKESKEIYFKDIDSTDPIKVEISLYSNFIVSDKPYNILEVTLPNDFILTNKNGSYINIDVGAGFVLTKNELNSQQIEVGHLDNDSLFFAGNDSQFISDRFPKIKKKYLLNCSLN